MSVQAGIWNFDGSPVDPTLIAAFSNSLEQQGPDGQSSYVDGSVALLYRPFHTTAESRRERQPYVSRRGVILTWDGRLDNRDELIAEVRNDLEADPTDVAIVSAVFDRWEKECFRRIIGDWAVSVWKPQHRELILAIDYMAIRHIFYYISKNRIWWSTDLSPLVLLSKDKFHIDDDYLAGYFAHEPDAHLTPFREITEVSPGQHVTVRASTASVGRYWQFNSNSWIRYKTDAEYEEHFRHVFRQSVRRRLRSDSPILAELSGGLDSSSIVCMADNILAVDRMRTPGLDTLSYYDKTEPTGDDWIYFTKIEEKRRRVGVHIDLSKLGATCAQLESEEFNPLPGCLGDSRQIDAERAHVIRSGGYRAVLSGIGGDEFLGGIPNPTSLLADLIVQLRFIALARQLVAWSLVKRRPWIHLLGQTLVDLLPASLGQYIATQARIEPWIEKTFAKRTKIARRLLDVSEHFGLWLPTRRSRIAGVISMANKLAKFRAPDLALEESRYPYLDQSLIEFTLSIPATQLLRPGERRSLMRRSLRPLVPQDILCRHTKQFSQRTPVVMLEQNWGELQTAFESSLSSSLGYIIGECFVDKMRAARNGDGIHIARMLKSISLEMWLRSLVSRQLIDVARA